MSFNSLKSNVYFNFLGQLQNPEVHLLATAIFDEPLIHYFSRQYPRLETLNTPGPSLFPLTLARQQALLALDKNPQHLQSFLYEGRHSQLADYRIGVLYERLWHFFLQHDADVKWVYANIPVREHKKTLGEFDFIYCHQQHGLVHLELAEKFYLYLYATQPDKNDLATAWENCVGPEKQDTLFRKANNLINKQIRLLDHPASQQAVIEEHRLQTSSTEADTLPLTEIANSYKHIHIGGRIFFNRTENIEIPGLNPMHVKSCWMQQQPFKKAIKEQKLNLQSLCRLQRYQWIAPFHAKQSDLSTDKLDEQTLFALTRCGLYKNKMASQTDENSLIMWCHRAGKPIQTHFFLLVTLYCI